MRLSRIDELRSRWVHLKEVSQRAPPDKELEELLRQLLQDCVEAGRYTRGAANRENLQWLARDVADATFALKEEYPLAAILPLEVGGKADAFPRIPQPAFKDSETERLSVQLGDLYAQREQLVIRGRGCQHDWQQDS